MSNPIEESARGDVAHQVVDWLTNEVGFRKKSTLVSARGEEKITIEEIQPLLQGDLASLLQFFSQHTVSTPNATRIRQTLASYCNYLTSNDSSGSGPDALEYLKLRGDIQDKDNREKDLAAEIRGLELDNRSSMQSISDIRTKKQAIETRIRDLRMQILVRQAMSENVRRLSQRMQLLVHEMTHGISTAQKAPASADLIQAIQGLGTERSSHQGNSGTSVNGLLTRLLSQVKQPMLQNQENSASEVGKRQQIIASIIYGLKDLEDKYLQMQNRRSSLSQESKVAESNLNQQIETLASELKMHAASTAATGDETNFQNTIPLVVLLDAASSVSRSQQHGQLMVPVETSALARSNTSVDAKVSELASMIRSIRQGMADIGNAVDITSEYAQKKVAAANKQLLEALRYPDLRKAFNQVKMSQLEQFQVDPGNEKKAGPFVTHNRYSGVERSQQIAELSHMANPELEMTMVSHESVVFRIASQILRDLFFREHMTSNVRQMSSDNYNRIVQLLGRENQDKYRRISKEKLLETIERDLCSQAQTTKEEAINTLESWEKESIAEDMLRLAEKAEDTEADIVHLSDTSGRFFTDAIASWHKSNGVSYAEYLRQLKIARTNNNDDDDDDNTIN